MVQTNSPLLDFLHNQTIYCGWLIFVRWENSEKQQIESIISRFLSLHIQIGFLWSSKRQCRHRGHLISLQSFTHHSHRKPKSGFEVCVFQGDESCISFIFLPEYFKVFAFVGNHYDRGDFYVQVLFWSEVMQHTYDSVQTSSAPFQLSAATDWVRILCMCASPPHSLNIQHVCLCPAGCTFRFASGLFNNIWCCKTQ